MAEGRGIAPVCAAQAGLLPPQPDAGDVPPDVISVLGNILPSVIYAAAPRGDVAAVHDLASLLAEDWLLITHPVCGITVLLYTIKAEWVEAHVILVGLAGVARDPVRGTQTPKPEQQDQQIHFYRLLL